MGNLKQVSIAMAIMMLVILANLNESKALVWWGKKVHVKITNRLSQNKDLLVHCKSREDDLGEHSLKSGDSYEFSFGEKFLWTSHFFCGFTFDGTTSFADAYDGKKEWIAENIAGGKLRRLALACIRMVSIQIVVIGMVFTMPIKT